MAPHGPRHRRLLRLAIATALATRLAAAHPELDRAVAHVERAEFDAALAILDRLDTAGALPRRDVVRLLEQRALVHLALGRRADAERSLRALAAIDPDHRFSPNTSPDLLTAFEFVRRNAPPPLRLSAVAEPASGGVLLRARLVGDAAGAVTGVGLRWRVDGGPPRRAEGTSVLVPLSPGSRVEFHAEARGRPGVLLETAPETYAAPRRAGISPWWYVAGGAAVVAAAVASVVILSSNGDRTQPGRPSLEGR